MLAVLKKCIDAFESDALIQQKDPILEKYRKM